MSLAENNLINIPQRMINLKPDGDNDSNGSGNGGGHVDTTHDAAIETYVNVIQQTGDSDAAEEARQGSYNDGSTGQSGL